MASTPGNSKGQHSSSLYGEVRYFALKIVNDNGNDDDIDDDNDDDD